MGCVRVSGWRWPGLTAGPPSGAGLPCNYTGSPVSQGPQITDLSWSSPLAPGGHAEAAHNVVGECADLGACRLNIKTFCINYNKY